MRKRRMAVAAVIAAVSVGAAAQGIGSPWSYPGDPGRDPMRPPPELYRADGRAELRVEVVVTSPAGSRALVRLGQDGDYTAVAVGDRVGDYRIVRIAPDGVIAVLSALGAQRSVVLPVDSTAPPGH